jgi:hypothetical protein
MGEKYGLASETRYAKMHQPFDNPNRWWSTLPYSLCPRCQLLAVRFGVPGFCPVCARNAYYLLTYLKSRQASRRSTGRTDRSARTARRPATPADAKPWALHDFDDQALIRLCRLRAAIREGAYADDRAPAVDHPR